MRRLQQVIIAIALLCSSSVMTELSIKQKELERAAELAVERAAEKAAERAVEKALNEGNSSTVTVTVKESYANAMKVAEEAAAPGAESTRPHDPNDKTDRQYGYVPGGPGQYKVYDSTEAEQLGISKESVNSSVEEQQGSVEGDGDGEGQGEGQSEAQGEEEAAESGEREEASKEEAESSDESRTKEEAKEELPTLSTSIKNFDHSDFGGDFAGLDLSGDFGLKSNSQTNTFLKSYSKPKDYPDGKVDVDEEDDAEIFKMYATNHGPGGWSSTKKGGWVRHRPLWDDSKSRVARAFWGGFTDQMAKPTDQKQRQRAEGNKQREANVKHVSEESTKEEPRLATLSLDSKNPTAGYQILYRTAKNQENNYEKIPRPTNVYRTIPMTYLPKYGAQNHYGAEVTTPKVGITTNRIYDEIFGDEMLTTQKSFTRPNRIRTRNANRSNGTRISSLRKDRSLMDKS